MCVHFCVFGRALTACLFVDVGELRVRCVLLLTGILLQLSLIKSLLS